MDVIMNFLLYSFILLHIKTISIIPKSFAIINTGICPNISMKYLNIKFPSDEIPSLDIPMILKNPSRI